jgi:hypothetical protein
MRDSKDRAFSATGTEVLGKGIEKNLADRTRKAAPVRPGLIQLCIFGWLVAPKPNAQIGAFPALRLSNCAFKPLAHQVAEIVLFCLLFAFALFAVIALFQG